MKKTRGLALFFAFLMFFSPVLTVYAASTNTEGIDRVVDEPIVQTERVVEAEEPEVVEEEGETTSGDTEKSTEEVTETSEDTVESTEEVTETSEVAEETTEEVSEGAEEVQTFTVEFFDTIDEKVFYTEEVKLNEAVKNIPEAPNHEGYKFKSFEGDYSKITENIQIKAIYEKIGTELSKTVGNYTITATGNIPEGVELVAEIIDSSKAEEIVSDDLGEQAEFKAEVTFDIKLMLNGEEYQPISDDKEVSITIKGIESDEDFDVYRITEDNEVTNMKAEVIDEGVVFDTEHFTTYTIGTTEYTSIGSGTWLNLSYNTYDTDNDNIADTIVLRGSTLNGATVNISTSSNASYYTKAPYYRNNIKHVIVENTASTLVSCSCDNMFYQCNNIVSVKYVGFSITRINHIFDGCTNLQSIDFSGSDLLKNNYYSSNYQDAFSNTASLREIKLPAHTMTYYYDTPIPLNTTMYIDGTNEAVAVFPMGIDIPITLVKDPPTAPQNMYTGLTYTYSDTDSDGTDDTITFSGNQFRYSVEKYRTINFGTLPTNVDDIKHVVFDNASFKDLTSVCIFNNVETVEYVNNCDNSRIISSSHYDLGSSGWGSVVTYIDLSGFTNFTGSFNARYVKVVKTPSGVASTTNFPTRMYNVDHHDEYYDTLSPESCNKILTPYMDTTPDSGTYLGMDFTYTDEDNDGKRETLTLSGTQTEIAGDNENKDSPYYLYTSDVENVVIDATMISCDSLFHNSSVKHVSAGEHADFSTVTDFDDMFYNVPFLQSIDLSNINATAGGLSLYYFIIMCPSLEYVDLRGMTGILSYNDYEDLYMCEKLKYIDISTWQWGDFTYVDENDGNTYDSSTNMYLPFDWCTSLEVLKLPAYIGNNSVALPYPMYDITDNNTLYGSPDDDHISISGSSIDHAMILSKNPGAVVTLVDEDGTELSQCVGLIGDPIDISGLDREGYIFRVYDADDNEVSVIPSTSVTYTVKYTPTTQTITFIDDNSVVLGSTTGLTGDAIDISTIERNGYTVKLYDTDDNVVTTVPAQDITLVVHYITHSSGQFLGMSYISSDTNGDDIDDTITFTGEQTEGVNITSSESVNYYQRAPYWDDDITSVVFNGVTFGTDISYLLKDCTNITQVIFTDTCDTSHITKMNNTFENCSGLTDLDLSNFSIENVITMNGLFNGCTALITLDISGFDMTNVMSADHVLDSCTALETLTTPLRTSDILNITLPHRMFDNISNASYEILPQDSSESLILETTEDRSQNSKWLGMDYTLEDQDGDGENETLILSGVQKAAINYVSSEGINSYINSPLHTTNIVKVVLDGVTLKNASHLFYDCQQLNIIEIKNCNTSQLTSIDSMFEGCSSLVNADLSRLDLSAISSEPAQLDIFNGCICLKRLNTPINTGQLSINIPKKMINESTGIYYTSIPSGLTASLSLICKKQVWLGLDYYYTDSDNDNIMDTVVFTGNQAQANHDDTILSPFDAQNWSSWDYNYYSSYSSFDERDAQYSYIPIRHIIIQDAKLVDCYNFFKGAYLIESIDFINVDTSEVENMEKFFYDCNSLQYFDLSTIDTSNVKNMSAMFGHDMNMIQGLAGIAGLAQNNMGVDISLLDTSSAENISSLFACRDLSNIDLSAFDFSHVTNMSGTFTGCTGVTETTFEGLDTDLVTNFNYTFYSIDAESLDLSSLDTSSATTMEWMFGHCRQLRELNISSFNTSNVTSMYGMFGGCSQLTDIDVSMLDTGNVTNMRSMFSGCGLHSLDLRSFNTSKVTTMDSMFQNSKQLVSIDLSSFTNESLRMMNMMCDGCANLVSFDYPNFIPRTDCTAPNAFRYCSRLESIDLSNSTISVSKKDTGMLEGCNSLQTFNTPAINKKYNDSCIVLPYAMKNTDNNLSYSNVYGRYHLVKEDLGTTQPTASTGTFQGLSYEMFDTDSDNIFDTMICTGAYNEHHVQRIWDTYKIKNLVFDGVYFNSNSFRQLLFRNSYIETVEFKNGCIIGGSSAESAFFECSKLRSIKFNDLSVNVSLSCYDMIGKCPQLVELDMGTFTVSSIDLKHFIADCENLTTLSFNDCNVGNVTDMTEMILRCPSLTSVDLGDLSVSGSGRSTVWDADTPIEYFRTPIIPSADTEILLGSRMFCEADGNTYYLLKGAKPTSLELIKRDVTTPLIFNYVGLTCIETDEDNDGIYDTLTLTGTQTESPTHTSNQPAYGQYSTSYYHTVKSSELHWSETVVFDANTPCSEQNIKHVIIKDATLSDMHFFYGCSNLESIKFENVDTSQVTDMNQLFYYCVSLEDLDLGDIDTSNVTNMSSMFQKCRSLLVLDVSCLDTSHVENMSYMFSGCDRFNTIDVSTLNTSNVTNMKDMFGDCTKVRNIINNFDTSSVTNMAGMFSGCESLLRIDTSSWVTTNVTDLNSIFCNCYLLKELNINHWDVSNVESMDSAFRYCESLKELDLSNWETPNCMQFGSMFTGSGRLQKLDLSNFIIQDGASADWMLYTLYHYTTGIDPSLRELKTPKVTPADALDTRLVPDWVNYGHSHPYQFVDDAGNVYTNLPTNLTESITLYRDDWLGMDFNYYDLDNDGVAETLSLGSYSTYVYGDGWIQTDDVSLDPLSRYYYKKAPHYNDEVTNLVITGHPTDLSYFLYNNSNIQSVTFQNVDSVYLQEAMSLFDNCSSLTSVNFVSSNLSGLIRTTRMFANTNLSTLDLSSFSLNLVEYADEMFEGTDLDSLETPIRTNSVTVPLSQVMHESSTDDTFTSLPSNRIVSTTLLRGAGSSVVVTIVNESGVQVDQITGRAGDSISVDDYNRQGYIAELYDTNNNITTVFPSTSTTYILQYRPTEQRIIFIDDQSGSGQVLGESTGYTGDLIDTSSIAREGYIVKLYDINGNLITKVPPIDSILIARYIKTIQTLTIVDEDATYIDTLYGRTGDTIVKTSLRRQAITPTLVDNNDTEVTQFPTENMTLTAVYESTGSGEGNNDPQTPTNPDPQTPTNPDPQTPQTPTNPDPGTPTTPNTPTNPRPSTPSAPNTPTPSTPSTPSNPRPTQPATPSVTIPTNPSPVVTNTPTTSEVAQSNTGVELKDNNIDDNSSSVSTNNQPKIETEVEDSNSDITNNVDESIDSETGEIDMAQKARNIAESTNPPTLFSNEPTYNKSKTIAIVSGFMFLLMIVLAIAIKKQYDKIKSEEGYK